jgi:hypothetical protein
MWKRRWVKRYGLSIVKRFSSRRAAPTWGAPRPTRWLALQLVDARRAVDGASLERAVLGVVAAEEGGVDDDAAQHAGQTELDDARVVARRAAPAALPAVHPLAAVGVLVLAPDRGLGLEQVLLLGEEVVVGPQHGAAEARGGEVGVL